MNDKIKTALSTQEEAEKDVHASNEEVEDESKENENKINTTQEELEAYFLIKNILKKTTGNPDDITYKDNERYMAILYKAFHILQV